jgi:lipopolysaccharide exporter
MSKIQKLLSGVGWGTFSTIAVTGFQLIFMAIMARMLEPSDFGLVAIANVSLRFFSYFAQMGTVPAIIQKPKIEEYDIAAALAVSLGVSILFFGLAQILAPLSELFFEIEGLSFVIQILSINFIVGGFSAVSIGLMRRNTQFKAIAIIEIITYVTGYGIVGLSSAYYGLGVWALVAAFMTQTTLTAMLSYGLIQHPLGMRHSAAHRKHFFSYGGKYSIIGFLEFLTSNLDSMVVGKILGVAPAGFYNRAFLLANLPVQQPANILTKTLYPIMSAVGNQGNKQIISLQLSTLLVGSYAFAVGVGIFIAAPDIVKLLLGNKWLETIPILQMLSWSVGPVYIAHVSGVTLDSLNKLRIKLYVQLTTLILLIIFIILSLPSGKASDIATAVVAAEWIRVIIMAWELTFLLKISIKETLIIGFCIFLIAFVCGALIFVVSKFMPADLNLLIRLGLEVFSGATGLILGLLISRLLMIRLPAIQFLADRAPFIAKIFPRFT